jgi:hypothetical protein
MSSIFARTYGRALAPAGVVDEKIDAAKRALRVLGHVLNVFVAGEIRPHDRRLTAILSNFFLNFFELGKTARSENEPAARLRQPERDRLADPPAGAGYKRHFIVECTHLSLADNCSVRCQNKTIADRLSTWIHEGESHDASITRRRPCQRKGILHLIYITVRIRGFESFAVAVSGLLRQLGIRRGTKSEKMLR